jgi:hypothetical protein
MLPDQLKEAIKPELCLESHAYADSRYRPLPSEDNLIHSLRMEAGLGFEKGFNYVYQKLYDFALATKQMRELQNRYFTAMRNATKDRNELLKLSKIKEKEIDQMILEFLHGPQPLQQSLPLNSNNI